MKKKTSKKRRMEKLVAVNDIIPGMNELKEKNFVRTKTQNNY